MRQDNKRLRINYKTYGFVETDYDESLVEFLSTVPNNSADPADVRIMKYYYNVQWPVIPAYNHNIPDVYLNYNVVQYGKK